MNTLSYGASNCDKGYSENRVSLSDNAKPFFCAYVNLTMVFLLEIITASDLLWHAVLGGMFVTLSPQPFGLSRESAGVDWPKAQDELFHT